MKKYFFILLTASLFLILSGCVSHINREHLTKTRSDFNSVVVRSWDEQMLTNLVRMRYRDNPMFLELANVVSTQSTKSAGNLGAEIAIPGAGSGTSDIGVSREQVLTPTLTYIPLQGEEFARRLLTPIPPSTILLLSQSGWSLERLLLCCVQQMNGVPNAISASGPTPDTAPDFALFRQLSESFRVLQIAGRIQIEMDSDGQSLLIYLNKSPRHQSDEAAETFVSLLKLEPNKTTYRITSKRVPSASDEIAMTGRSLLSVMFFLSQSVEIPPIHEAEGKVTRTTTADGSRFDWSSVTGKVMNIRSSESEPTDAAVKIYYRNSWFYIADNDLNSKTTFNLLMFLFNLQAAHKGGAEPLLTYPVR